MKKGILSITITVVVVLVLVYSIAFAFLLTDDNPRVRLNDDLAITKTVKFDTADSSANDEVTAANKLEKLELTPKMKELLLKKFPDEIRSAESIFAKTSFFVQDDSGTLSQVNESDYTAAVKEQGQANKGALRLVTMVIAEGGDFLCAEVFQWEIMPKSRYTDAICLSMDGKAKVGRHSEYGYFEYKHTNSNVEGDKNTTTETIEKEITFSDLKHFSNGCAYEIELEADARRLKSIDTYSDLTGFVCCEGWCSSDTMNFWTTYAHQKKVITLGGIDFSKSFGIGFSTRRSSAYDQVVDEFLWET